MSEEDPNKDARDGNKLPDNVESLSSRRERLPASQKDVAKGLDAEAFRYFPPEYKRFVVELIAAYGKAKGVRWDLLVREMEQKLRRRGFDMDRFAVSSSMLRDFERGKGKIADAQFSFVDAYAKLCEIDGDFEEARRNLAQLKNSYYRSAFSAILNRRNLAVGGYDFKWPADRRILPLDSARELDGMCAPIYRSLHAEDEQFKISSLLRFTRAERNILDVEVLHLIGALEDLASESTAPGVQFGRGYFFVTTIERAYSYLQIYGRLLLFHVAETLAVNSVNCSDGAYIENGGRCFSTHSTRSIDRYVIEDFHNQVHPVQFQADMDALRRKIHGEADGDAKTPPFYADLRKQVQPQSLYDLKYAPLTDDGLSKLASALFDKFDGAFADV